jgi:hypothetical protein
MGTRPSVTCFVATMNPTEDAKSSQTIFLKAKLMKN